MKRLALAFTLVFGQFALGQTQIGYTLKYNSTAYFPESRSNLNQFNYYEGFLQTRVTNIMDLKMCVGWNPSRDVYYRVSTPFYLTHKPNEKGYSQGFLIEPILSYRSIHFDGAGGGLGLGYQHNWGALSFSGGIRSIYETALRKYEGPYAVTSAWSNELYLSLGVWLSRTDSEYNLDLGKSSYWITGAVGYDEEFLKYSGRVMTSFEDREWFAVGFEFVRSKRRGYWNGDGSGSTPQVVTISPINAYLGRVDFRPVQFFNPSSSWDPFLSVHFGSFHDLDSDEWIGTGGVSTGLRYWFTDHLGASLEYGVITKLGLHLGISYRLQ